MAFFLDNLGKPVPEGQTILDFTEARDDGVAVASAGTCASHLHLASDTQPHQHLTCQLLQARCSTKSVISVMALD